MNDTQLITGRDSDEVVRAELIRMVGRAAHLDDDRVEYAQELLSWILKGETELYRSRRYTAIRQAYTDHRQDWPNSGTRSYTLIARAEEILVFLNGEL